MAISRILQLSFFAVTLLAGTAFAHTDVKDRASVYWYDSNGHNWKNNYGQCWRTGYWTPSAANCECDKAILPKEKCEPPAPKVEAKKQDTVPATPLVPPVGPSPAPFKFVIQAEALFDFDKAVLRKDGKTTLDNEVVGKMKEHPEVEVVLITGHADRIGKEAYNKKLSQKRADAVKKYLTEQGIDQKRLETASKGESEPVVDCKDIKGAESGKNKKLVECLQPNRRVVLEVKVQKQQ